MRVAPVVVRTGYAQRDQKESKQTKPLFTQLFTATNLIDGKCQDWPVASDWCRRRNLLQAFEFNCCHCQSNLELYWKDLFAWVCFAHQQIVSVEQKKFPNIQ